MLEKQLGFDDSTLGTAIYRLCWITAISLLIVVMCCCADNMLADTFGPGSWAGDTSCCNTTCVGCDSFPDCSACNPDLARFFFNDAVQSLCFFILFLHIAAVWVVTLRFYNEVIRNFFRVGTPLPSCHYVMIEVRHEHTVINNDTGLVADLVKRYDYWHDRLISNVVKVTVPVLKSQGSRYFIYKLTRYVYDVNLGYFRAFKVRMPETHGHFTKLDGLTSDKAERVRATIGLNQIAIPVPSLFESIQDEFFQFFYIYQFFTLAGFFCTQYYDVGSCYVATALGSGLGQMLLKREAQQKVQRMVRQHQTVACKRDGAWRRLDSIELVPGDMLAIEGGTLTCDCVLIRGTCVVDESMLTGESAPVAKNACPANASTFSVEGSKKHVLFAGTRVSGSDVLDLHAALPADPERVVPHTSHMP